MLKRFTSALMWFPLVLIILLIRNKYIVDICLAIIAYLALNEYFNAVSNVSNPVRWIGYLCCASIAIISSCANRMATNNSKYISTNFASIIICTSNSYRYENNI